MKILKTRRKKPKKPHKQAKEKRTSISLYLSLRLGPPPLLHTLVIISHKTRHDPPPSCMERGPTLHAQDTTQDGASGDGRGVCNGTTLAALPPLSTCHTQKTPHPHHTARSQKTDRSSRPLPSSPPLTTAYPASRLRTVTPPRFGTAALIQSHQPAIPLSPITRGTLSPPLLSVDSPPRALSPCATLGRDLWALRCGPARPHEGHEGEAPRPSLSLCVCRCRC